MILSSDEVIALLKMTAKKYGQTIVMITHDDEIAQVADRILVIEGTDRWWISDEDNKQDCI